MSNLSNVELNKIHADSKLKIPGFNKLKKDDKLKVLLEKGVLTTEEEKKEEAAVTPASVVPNPSAAVKKAKVTKPTKPKMVKLEKQITEKILPSQYSETLIEIKEAIKFANLVPLVREDIEIFIKSTELKELEEFVNRYGILTVIEYLRLNQPSNLLHENKREIYEIIAIFIFMSDPKALDPLIKSFKKEKSRLRKALKNEPQASIQEVKRVEAPKTSIFNDSDAEDTPDLDLDD